MNCPSGDHAGRASHPPPLVSCTASPPVTGTSHSRPMMLTAMRPPSGDRAGSMAPRSSTSVRVVPAAGAAAACWAEAEGAAAAQASSAATERENVLRIMGRLGQVGWENAGW